MDRMLQGGCSWDDSLVTTW